MDNMVTVLVTLVRVTNSPSQAVCDKAAFSVHGYFALKLGRVVHWKSLRGRFVGATIGR